MVQLRLVHPPDETVDLDLAVAGLATLDVMLALDVEAANGGGKLEGPEEVADLLEVGAAGDNLVDKILNADNAILTKALLKIDYITKTYTKKSKSIIKLPAQQWCCW